MKKFIFPFLFFVSFALADYPYIFTNTVGISMVNGHGWGENQRIREVFKPYSEVKIGDVVIYCNSVVKLNAILNHKIVLNMVHRVIKAGKIKGTWIMKGDGNLNFDPGVLSEKNYIAIADPVR